MRTLGRPSASTVASAIASGSLGSAFLASSNQAANRRSGSSASVKSPLLNQVGCSIGTVSDIIGGLLVTGYVPGPAYRLVYRGLGYSLCAGMRVWRALRQVARRRHAGLRRNRTNFSAALCGEGAGGMPLGTCAPQPVDLRPQPSFTTGEGGVPPQFNLCSTV